MIEIDDALPSVESTPGRSCPLDYRYTPEEFTADAPEHLRSLDVLYVVGGLYGNDLALERVLELFGREHGRKRLVFNGDFHWLDADPTTFARVQRAALAHEALRGNVETELALTDSTGVAGCGCAYPGWVDEASVERSNRILARLRTVADARQRVELSGLPMWLRADVGSRRLGIVHGDATSLAGWGFAQEHLRAPDHLAKVTRWMDRAGVDAFACTHTCLPVFQALGSSNRKGARWILNNGAAGMPNFRGDAAGLLTRIAVEPSTVPPMRYGIDLGSGVVAEAIPIDIDLGRWHSRLATLWPEGSDAHLSYFDRMVHGPDYAVTDAVRFQPQP